MKHDEKMKIDGRELILEDLRQHCLSLSAQDWDSDVFNMVDDKKKSVAKEI